ncbi:hypothetical protein [Streptomyces sp. NPDC046821]|uniref:LppU/SCO3897 family protein n=1 Tax=Streptomyces sp. NPDC046821 TaxID=3154702 RepID=UPI0033E9E2CA
MTTPPPQGQNPYPPHAQGAPIPPAPAPVSGGGGKKVLRIVALIVVAIALYGVKWYLGQSDAETTAVGSCMHNDGSTSSPDLQTVDCSSSDSEFKVIEKFDNSSDESKCNSVSGTEVSYYQTGGSHDVVLCLKTTK